MQPTPSEAAVSSVVGTVLMLSITVAVFGGFSVVALSYLQEQPHAPRSDLSVVASEQSLLFAHQGGEGFSTADNTLYVNVDGYQQTIELTDAQLAAYGVTLADLGLDDGWDVGDVLCVWGQEATCLFDPDDVQVLGVHFVDENTLLLEHGERGLTAPALAPDLVVSLLSQSPTAPATGNTVTWSVRVTNQGTADTAAIPIVVAIEVDGASVALATVTGPLAIGATADATSTPAWTATAGSHDLDLVADSTDAVAETAEGNNVASSTFTVSTAVADPGQAFLDADDDGLYTAGTDTLIPNADVTDCVYDAGSDSLVVPPSVGAISASSCNLASDATLVVQVDLTASSGSMSLEAQNIVVASGVTLESQGSMSLVNDPGTFTGDGATFLSQGAISIGSSAGGHLGTVVNLVGATLDNSDGSSGITIHWEDGDLDATGATFLSKGAIDIGGHSSGHEAGDVLLDGAVLDNADGSSAITLDDITGSISATGSGTRFTSKGAITLTAGTDIDVSGAELDNQDGSSAITLTASGTLTAAATPIDSKGAITLTASGALDVAGAALDNQDGSSAVSLTTSSTLSGAGLSVHSKGQIAITASSGIDLANAVLDNENGSSQISVQSSGGSVTATGLNLDSKGAVSLTASTGLSLTNADIDNQDGSGTGTFTTTTGAVTCNPCTLRIKGSTTVSGASLDLASATMAISGSGNDLQLTATAGAITATSGSFTVADLLRATLPSSPAVPSNYKIAVGSAVLDDGNNSLDVTNASGSGVSNWYTGTPASGYSVA